MCPLLQSTIDNYRDPDLLNDSNSIFDERLRKYRLHLGEFFYVKNLYSKNSKKLSTPAFRLFKVNSIL